MRRDSGVRRELNDESFACSAQKCDPPDTDTARRTRADSPSGHARLRRLLATHAPTRVRAPRSLPLRPVGGGQEEAQLRRRPELSSLV